MYWTVNFTLPSKQTHSLCLTINPALGPSSLKRKEKLKTHYAVCSVMAVVSFTSHSLHTDDLTDGLGLSQAHHSLTNYLIFQDRRQGSVASRILSA